MQLTQFTDYSLRTLIYLALSEDRVCTISEISDSYHISRSHLTKVVFRLSQLDVIKTTRGKNGGMQLKLSPEEINLGSLIQKVEPNFYIVECFDKENGQCVISPVCKLKHILGEAKDSFLAVLNKYTLADIVENRDQLNQIFFT